MTTFVDRDLELYVMGAFDGDREAIEEFIAASPQAQAFVAEQARTELLMREIAGQAAFCPSCDDVVAGERCLHCGAAVSAGGYAIERVLVETAHGRLYEARDADGRRVALKELAFVQTPDDEALAAFEREAKFLRALEHPAIPHFVASFREGQGVDTRLYLAQEFIEGESLAGRLDNHFFSEEEVVAIAREVLDVLVYLQSLSPIVVHRDIKPANLIRREDGSIAVVDFGAALDQGQTQGSTAVGTFGYMPLEQMAGIVDSTTDIYSLGASLWHLLTRREPWEILGNAEAMEAANVSDSLASYLRKMTAAKPSERFPSAAAARDALERREVVAVERHRRRGRRHSARRGSRFIGWPLAFTAVSIVGLGVGGHIATTAIRADSARSMHGDLRSSPGAGVRPASSSESPAAPSTPAPAAETEQEHESAEPPELESVPIRGGDAAVDFTFDGDLRQGLQTLAEKAGVNIVLPGYVRGHVDVSLSHLPWQAAFESILEAQGLWYRYAARGNVVRVEARQALAREHVEDRDDEGLPAGGSVDLSLEDGDLRHVLKAIGAAGVVNMVIPDYVRGRVSVKLHGVPWDQALRTVLASVGLTFSYRQDGKVVRISERQH